MENTKWKQKKNIIKINIIITDASNANLQNNDILNNIKVNKYLAEIL